MKIRKGLGEKWSDPTLFFAKSSLHGPGGIHDFFRVRRMGELVRACLNVSKGFGRVLWYVCWGGRVSVSNGARLRGTLKANLSACQLN